MKSSIGICIDLKDFDENSCIAEYVSQDGEKIRGIIKNFYKKTNKSNATDVANLDKITWYGKEGGLGILAVNSNIKKYGLEATDYSSIKKINRIVTILKKCDNISSLCFEMFVVFLTNIKTENSDFLYIKLKQLLLTELGFGLKIDKCVKTGWDSFYLSPNTGHGVSIKIGEAYKDKVFIIPQALKNNEKTDCFDFDECEKILEFFLKKHLL